ncbi:hypothetical protein [Streptomyces cavernicola]|uniref:Uncharacterized protein n=1 Tax=Streptomyces cavernicola TaxID=3043613 RepID=A0ABT6SJP8_9ACTN|nr:hypothetical protein [Streptomyces sp. B-S-A6]MDI3408422.1 hypothetical protein [Streptomyces sp. B-S-A6]
MDAHETRDRLNLTRRYIAALSDLVWSAAATGNTTTQGYYSAQRKEASRDLKARVIAAVRDRVLTSHEGDRALSPISSLEDALVFTD